MSSERMVTGPGRVTGQPVKRACAAPERKAGRSRSENRRQRTGADFGVVYPDEGYLDRVAARIEGATR